MVQQIQLPSLLQQPLSLLLLYPKCLIFLPLPLLDVTNTNSQAWKADNRRVSIRRFKAKERRGYLQRVRFIGILEFCLSTPPTSLHASTRNHVTELGIAQNCDITPPSRVSSSSSFVSRNRTIDFRSFLPIQPKTSAILSSHMTLLPHPSSRPRRISGINPYFLAKTTSKSSSSLGSRNKSFCAHSS